MDLAYTLGILLPSGLIQELFTGIYTNSLISIEFIPVPLGPERAPYLPYPFTSPSLTTLAGGWKTLQYH